VKGEVSPHLIVEAAQKLGKRCYLPVLALDKPDHLWFMPFHKDTVFIKNRFGIPEPKIEADRLFPPQDLDLVITPLVAFDAQCHRIGMGAGFYDRTFAFLQATPRPAKPLLCGLAYGFQQVDDTRPQAWDIALNYVITDEFCLKAMGP
jgi:5-formyltetrahydrofolate cyclo-ligase